MNINNASLKIAEQTNYLNKDILYLKNVSIVEYDIKSAGFNVLKFLKLLPEETLKKWEKLDKHTRTVNEGLLQKEHPEIAEKIISTLAKVRSAFIAINNIQPEDILAIKKDAIFLINKTPKTTVIKELFEFRKKNTYTSYIYLNKKEFYLNSATKILDIKGVSEKGKEIQNDFLIADIAKILTSAEKIEKEKIFILLKTYRSKYLRRELPIETYRDLNTATYKIGNYSIENLPEEEKKQISISENYINYIIPLIQILV